MKRHSTVAAVPLSRPLRRQWWRLPLLLLAVVALVILAFAAQLAFSQDIPWLRALEFSVGWWTIPCGVLLLGISLTYVAPLEQGRWWWTLPLHITVCAVVVSVAVHVEGERIAARRNAERNRPPRESVETPQTQMPPTPPAAAPAATPGENVPTEARRPREGSEGGPRRFFAALFASARWQLFLAIYAVSVSVGSAWRLRQHAVERERKALELTASLSQAKLEALRLQLQPHFLFNTLNAIATLVHRDANAADEMITNLGDLLRLVLAATETEVPLRRELDLVDRYLAIERLRLGDRLKVEREIDPHVLDAAVPPLMLQTLIENAVRHGLEPRRAPGTITVRATRDGERLRLVVADDGVGLPPIDVKTERRGVGLVNTEARLHELHGAAARMVMLAPPEGGTRVEIELPCRRLAATAPKAVEA